jgi:hypothetical protein
VFDFIYTQSDFRTFLNNTVGRILFRDAGTPLLLKEALPLGDVRFRVKKAQEKQCNVT